MEIVYCSIKHQSIMLQKTRCRVMWSLGHVNRWEQMTTYFILNTETPSKLSEHWRKKKF